MSGLVGASETFTRACSNNSRLLRLLTPILPNKAVKCKECGECVRCSSRECRLVFAGVLVDARRLSAQVQTARYRV
jgi:hypothetical protein